MQAPTVATIMAMGPVQPFEWMQPIIPELPNPTNLNPGYVNPGEEPYEAYGLSGLQNPMSDI